MAESKPSPLWAILSLGLIIVGLVFSSYLLTVHLRLVEDASYQDDICSTVFKKSCSETLMGPYSTFLKIPTAGWGIVYFGALATLLLLGWTMGAGFVFEASLAAFVLSLVGGLGSVALTVVMLTGGAEICPLCMVVHGANLALVYPLRKAVGRTDGQVFLAVVGAVRYVFGATVDDEEKSRWKVLGLLTCGLVAVMLYQWVYVRSQLEQAQHYIRVAEAKQSEGEDDVVEAFEKTEAVAINIRPDDPVRGPAGAPVTMTVFSDFQCPFCAKFEATLPGLLEMYPDTLRLVFKHFPLDRTCNTMMETELHPQACNAAEASEAARIQGKFWEFHDLLFGLDHEADMAKEIDTMAAELGLDVARFNADRASLEVAKRVREDIAQGIDLGVEGTPWIYINGRVSMSTDIEDIARMIDIELGIESEESGADEEGHDHAAEEEGHEGHDHAAEDARAEGEGAEDTGVEDGSAAESALTD